MPPISPHPAHCMSTLPAVPTPRLWRLRPLHRFQNTNPKLLIVPWSFFSACTCPVVRAPPTRDGKRRVFASAGPLSVTLDRINSAHDATEDSVPQVQPKVQRPWEELNHRRHIEDGGPSLFLHFQVSIVRGSGRRSRACHFGRGVRAIP